MVYVFVHVQMFLRICQIEGRKCWTSTIEILLESGLRIYRLLSHMQLIQHLGKMTVQMRNLPLKSRKIAGKLESGIRSPGLRCMSPDYDTKEIKNIYVDCSGGKPVASRKVDSPNHLFTIISLSHDS